jgi:hypothetical protein
LSEGWALQSSVLRFLNRGNRLDRIGDDVTREFCAGVDAAGQRPLVVADDQLRRYGMQGLRVIDASVMPAVTSTNTNAPTIMIAETGATVSKAATRERLAV